MTSKEYVEKVYAGFLGMNAGIRLGAPLEPTEWSDKTIQEVYGDLKGYVKEYKNFAADDDANGPVFFIRALYDADNWKELKPQDIGNTWLNYSREGVGMFWWGGDQISTEHTAFINLSKGIEAPQSGSIETNGLIIAEQIGGQIFIDTWGLICPGQIEKAADYAEKAASVSHDGNGIYGARFMAACIAKAFEATTIKEVIEAGLSVIPHDSTYADVVRAVIDFHEKDPNNFRNCRNYLEEEWGYDKFTGVCHIIPNAGVCALALLYGEGSFSRAIEIATMCGWDTDCNAGNVGTIVGVYNGIEGIPQHYRSPINDSIVTSSVVGYLNIVDIPTFSKEIALLGYQVLGEDPPKTLKESFRPGEIYFDFEFPGSTHGIRTDNSFKTKLAATSNHGLRSGRSLEIMFDRMVEGDMSKIFYKPFYRREDFNDERYKPNFAPQAYSGQTVSTQLYLDKWSGEEVHITPYVRETFQKKTLALQPVVLKNQDWNDIEFTIPDTHGAIIDEVGFIIESPSPRLNRAIGRLYMGEFHIYGKGEYGIDFSKQAEEFLSVLPFSHNRGQWSIENEAMKSIASEGCSSFTGNYYTENVRLETTISLQSGSKHGIIFRALGIQRHYLVAFDDDQAVSLFLNQYGYRKIQSEPFAWQHDKEYRIKVECKADEVIVSIDEKVVLKGKCSQYSHGMFGVGSVEGGEVIYKDFHIKEL